ncbi:phage scaffolding protein [Bacillus sp. Gen3]|nr:phage scaffolding protein [Bacillus sp. Gen3]
MKELLEKLAKGETTVEDVLKAIDEADKDKVPRSRLNDKIDEIKELDKQLKERDQQLEDLSEKAKGNEELTQQIKELKEKNEQTTKDFQEKLEKQAFDFALESTLRDAKAKNPKAVKALLNTEAIKLDGDKLLGLEEQLNALKESDGYLFVEEEQPGLKGRKPNDTTKPPETGKNPWEKGSVSLGEQGRILREEPDKARQLIINAGLSPATYGL